MSAPQSLIQAAMNRLRARLGSGLADSAASLAVLAQEAPERLRREWELFWEEVEQEAERLETRGQRAGYSPATPAGEPWSQADREPLPTPQDQIDELRARVAALSRRLEDRS
jgi:hypothetical protein